MAEIKTTKTGSTQPRPDSLKSTGTNKSSSNIVGVHYKVGKKIGEGSFGVLYEGLNMLNNQLVAIKFEPRKCEAPQLRDEFRTYKIMRNTVGVPNVYYFGHEGIHNILVIDLLGPSLEDMFDLCGRKFSIKTTCMVAKQMISRVQSIHENHLIYRDIKPDNFLIGKIPRFDPTKNGDFDSIVAAHQTAPPHPASQVFVVDFGMAKQYRDPKTKTHIPYREKKSLSGTARYMSINTHMGREQSRRDDLESLGNVFMYFLRGNLPWQGLKAANNKQKYEKIGEKKQLTLIKDLCEGFPDGFNSYLNAVRSLKFDEEPDYDHLRNYFNKVLHKIGEVDDGVFDWMIVMDAQRKEKFKKLDSSSLNVNPNHSSSMVMTETPSGADDKNRYHRSFQSNAANPRTSLAVPSPNQSVPLSPIGNTNLSVTAVAGTSMLRSNMKKTSNASALKSPSSPSVGGATTKAKTTSNRSNHNKDVKAAAAILPKKIKWYQRMFKCFNSSKNDE